MCKYSAGTFISIFFFQGVNKLNLCAIPFRSVARLLICVDKKKEKIMRASESVVSTSRFLLFFNNMLCVFSVLEFS